MNFNKFLENTWRAIVANAGCGGSGQVFSAREDIEVVVTSLPKGRSVSRRETEIFSACVAAARNFLMGWLGYEKVNVLWHDYVSQHLESIALAVSSSDSRNLSLACLGPR